MSRIRILPDLLANKIAAGEVVERPASVIKELVENALDAHSSRITVEIEKGGRALIQVADNGIGMGRDDALLSVERFATSKLHQECDLAAIRTLGFRGEALPSIAAVSRLTLTTREREASVGVQVQLEGGRITQVNEAGAPPGTLVRVAQLFFNTPARRKFLKSIGTEMGHAADVVAGLALGSPQVHFTLLHDSRVVHQWPKVSDPVERAADVMGPLPAADLIRVEGRAGELTLTGFLAPEKLARATSRGLFLFVNGRRVRDRVMQHALLDGYHGRLMKGRYPLAALFLQLPYDRVDVNVHPTKHEVRFADARRVHALVSGAVAAALDRSLRRPWPAPHQPPPGADERVGESPAAYGTGAAGPPEPRVEAPDAPQEWPADRPPGPVAPGRLQARPAAPAGQQALWAARGLADLTVIGQLHGTYIVCQDPEGLLLIDQHAAHERIVYEQLEQSAGPAQVQRLLVPETVELGFSQARLLERLLPGLAAMGLEIEAFGGTTFAVKAIPALLADHDMGRLVGDLIEKSLEIGISAGEDRIMDECRRVMACHRAVRASQHLDQRQMAHLLAQLDRCRNSSHCPHGRPIWVRWSLAELQKTFGRSG